MKDKKIKNKDVKKYFLLADAFKERARHHKELGMRVLNEEYNREFDYFWGLNESQLNDRITDKVRLGRYERFDWYYGDKKLEDMGVWPKMYSLDIGLTTGNVPETAEIIKGVYTGLAKLSYDNKEEEIKRTFAFENFIKKYKSIRDLSDFLIEKFPIIVLPGGEIREKDYNVWARENKQPLCEIYKNDIDDGSNRAVSYALDQIKEIPCFYAVEKKKNK